MRRAGQHITIETEAFDVARFMAREHGRRTWDLLIGQAFLDLIDMPTTLPGLCSLVRPGGLLYFPPPLMAIRPSCRRATGSSIGP